MGNLGSWSYVDGRERGAKRPGYDRARRRWSISSVTFWNSEEGTTSAIGVDNDTIRDINVRDSHSNTSVFFVLDLDT